MSDTITLTRKEVREAGEDWAQVMDEDEIIDYTCFFAQSPTCYIDTGFCRLCKRLTEFAKGEEDVAS